MARLGDSKGQIDIARGVGNYCGGCVGAALGETAIGGLSDRIETNESRISFDTRTAAARGLARVGI